VRQRAQASEGREREGREQGCVGSNSLSCLSPFGRTSPDAILLCAVPKLHYFAFRGRALACRVALFNSLGKEGWADERVSLPRFKKAPKPASNPDRVNAEYITNNLPQLDLPCGTKLSQSHAIARYAAKLIPADPPPHFVPELYPSDAKSAMLVDEAIAVVDQILLLTPKDGDPAVRAKQREEYKTSGFLRVGMELLEGRLKQSGGAFLLGAQLSIADLYVRAPLCDLFELNQFEGVEPEFLDDFPMVRACGKAVLEHPLLKTYHENYKN
jgi:glutathione S-transferase